MKLKRIHAPRFRRSFVHLPVACLHALSVRSFLSITRRMLLLRLPDRITTCSKRCCPEYALDCRQSPHLSTEMQDFLADPLSFNRGHISFCQINDTCSTSCSVRVLITPTQSRYTSRYTCSTGIRSFYDNFHVFTGLTLFFVHLPG